MPNPFRGANDGSKNILTASANRIPRQPRAGLSNPLSQDTNGAGDFLELILIDPKKYGTASEVSEATKIPRTTLISAAKRKELTHCHSLGGTLLIELDSVRAWSKIDRKTGPKPAQKSNSAELPKL